MDMIQQFPHLPHDAQEAILNGPALKPPDGIVSNFANPTNRNDLAIAVSVVCISLACTLIPLRAYSRIFVIKEARIEDYLGLAAFVSYIGLVWAFYAQLHYGGYFVHQWDIRFKDFQTVIKIGFTLTLIYSMTMILAKTAILFEWTHIFLPTGTRSAFFWACRIMMVLNFLIYTAGILAESLNCINVAKTWTPWLSGKCIDKKALDITTAYFNLAMDLLILLLPQGVIWKLQMTRERKIGISVIFSFGILTIICASLRIWKNTPLPYVAYTDKVGDTNYDLGAVYICGFTEMTCVLIVFAVPAVPKAFTDSWLGSRITTAFRSWAWASSSGGGSSKNSGVRPRLSHRLSHHAKDEDSQVQLTYMEPIKVRDTRSPYIHGPLQENGGIVCRIDIDIDSAEDTVSKTSRDGISSSQHPWIERQ